MTTLQTFNTLSINEQDEIAALFANWLSKYTKEVIIKVMEKQETLLNDVTFMTLLKELKKREDAEKKEFEADITWLFRNYDDFKEFDPHNHALTHAKSYRDVLYDLYIKNL